jgi:HlyD family secretion protein
MRLSVRKLGWVGLGALAVGLLVWSFLPAPVEVDLAAVTRGTLRVTVHHEGKTRIRDRYVVAAPLAGRLRRIEWRAGDPVRAGKTLLTVIDPTDPSLLDARARAEAEARVRAAVEARAVAEANRDQAQAELERGRKLRAQRAISQEEYENLEYKVRTTALSVRIAVFELELARAALVRTRPRGSPGEPQTWGLEIPAPIDGVVLEVLQESERVVQAGAELLRVGDPLNLECVIDVLSPDAVRIREVLSAHPPVRVLLEHWGGERPLNGRVRRVEPAGFLKVSALGVEEQRVNVIVDFTDPPARWQALGDAYRVEARIILWEGQNVVKVPSGALFRHGGGWAVFRVEGERAVLRPVRVGRDNGLDAEVLGGLEEGDRVVIHPGDKVRDGVAVSPRTPAG